MITQLFRQKKDLYENENIPMQIFSLEANRDVTTKHTKKPRPCDLRGK
jgi:hypothetical protein